MFKRAKARAELTFNRIRHKLYDKSKLTQASTEGLYESDGRGSHESALDLLIKRLASMPDEFELLHEAVIEISISASQHQVHLRADPGYLGLVENLSELLTALDNCLDQNQAWSLSMAQLARGINRETRLLEEQLKVEDEQPQLPTSREIKVAISGHRRIQALLAHFMLTDGLNLWPPTPLQSQKAATSMPSISAATYNSPESSSIGRVGCTTGTCVGAMQQIRVWAKGCSSQRIQWITGSAGMGKTTIAYSLCEYLEQGGLLAASFFCSRRLGCSQGRDITAALSYQLAEYSPAFKSTVSEVIRCFPEVLRQPVTMQVVRLLVIPLRKVGHTFPVGATVVLDGLNECESTEDVIQMLSEIIKNASYLPVKFLFTSRTHLCTTEALASPEAETVKLSMFLDEFNVDLGKEEIESYLRSSLGKTGIPVGQTFSHLTLTSFAYATTLIQYLNADLPEPPQERLLRVQSSRLVSCAEKNRSPLSRLYASILDAMSASTGNELSNQVLGVLHLLACAKQPLTRRVLTVLSDMVPTESLQETVLQFCQNLCGVPNNTSLIAVNESFSDSICDKSLPETIRCNQGMVNAQLARACFDLISLLSQPNICNLQSSFMPNQELSGPSVNAKHCSPPELLYAYRYWTAHLCKAHIDDQLISQLHIFLSTKMIVWLEYMSLTGRLRDVENSANDLSSWKKAHELPTENRLMLDDAFLFIKGFISNKVFDYTPHLYLSALACWPTDLPISKHYRHSFCSLPILRLVMRYSRSGETVARGNQAECTATHVQSTSALVQTVKHHTGEVKCVAYSPNGAYIASGSDDYNIWICDSHSGWLVGRPLIGHTNMVFSVAYSPDSAYLVSGSVDNTVRIWDAHTGQQVNQPLTGHTGSVYSVAYSPDGAYIASGSYDTTIRIWDAKTGKQVGKPLIGHTVYVLSVVYSPDGAYIASGSGDDTIRIWDAHTGQQIGVLLTGHTAWVYSVAYSPDGAHIASGSWDNTIRIWDAHTGQQVGQTLTGHTNDVKAVAYSPDGAYIASGSDDKTIRIWDAKTGKQVGKPLTGHTNWVYSVAFSPDGAYLASGSWDKTVRIWDVQHHINQTIPIEILTDDASSEGYTIDRNGWVFDDKQNRLVCIPPSLQRQYRSRCTGDEILQLDLRGVKLGEGWYQCYKPRSVNEKILSEKDTQAL